MMPHVPSIQTVLKKRRILSKRTEAKFRTARGSYRDFRSGIRSRIRQEWEGIMTGEEMKSQMVFITLPASRPNGLADRKRVDGSLETIERFCRDGFE